MRRRGRLSFGDAAVQVLRDAGEPLHASEICDRALRQGLTQTPSEARRPLPPLPSPQHPFELAAYSASIPTRPRSVPRSPQSGNRRLPANQATILADA